jgi:ABC-type lipoprotein release transport system permease subunit
LLHAADPATYAIGTVLIAAVAFAAAWPPALRASRTNATEALRSD